LICNSIGIFIFVFTQQKNGGSILSLNSLLEITTLTTTVIYVYLGQ